MSKVKGFKGMFLRGDIVKAYDFQPMEGRADKFVIGKVVGVEQSQEGWMGYLIEVIEDSLFPEGGRDEILAPFRVGFMEYDERITMVKAARPGSAAYRRYARPE